VVRLTHGEALVDEFCHEFLLGISEFLEHPVVSFPIDHIELGL
jgi:hypothetical protein